MLQHTSGIPSYAHFSAGSVIGMTNQDVLEALMTVADPESPPGAMFLYNDVPYSLLATIAIVVVTKFTALRRSILGWRKVPPAGTALWTATAITPATTAPTSAPTAITSASVMLLALAVIATVISEIMAGTPGVILSWVEVWREVLRRRSIGFRLALFS